MGLIHELRMDVVEARRHLERPRASMATIGSVHVERIDALLSELQRDTRRSRTFRRRLAEIGHAANK